MAKANNKMRRVLRLECNLKQRKGTCKRKQLCSFLRRKSGSTQSVAGRKGSIYTQPTLHQRRPRHYFAATISSSSTLEHRVPRHEAPMTHTLLPSIRCITPPNLLLLARCSQEQRYLCHICDNAGRWKWTRPAAR